MHHNHNACLIGNFRTLDSPTKGNVNLVGWSKNIGTPQFPKDDKNVSPRRTPESIELGLVGIAVAAFIGIMSANIPEKARKWRE